MEEAENGQDEDGHEIELGMSVLDGYFSCLYALQLVLGSLKVSVTFNYFNQS